MKKIGTLLMMLLCVFLLFGCAGNVEKIAWENIALNDVIPAPRSNLMDLWDNDEDNLDVYIYRISENDYWEYVRKCKEDFGFTIDVESYSSSFLGYNQAGYYLDLYYNDSEKEMRVSLKAPLNLTEYEWPDIAVLGELPKPDAVVGCYDWNNDDGFVLYVGDTSKESYKAYVNVCKSAGYTVDEYSTSKSFSAKNKRGCNVDISYKGYNTVRINFEIPEGFSSLLPDENGQIPLPASSYTYLWEDYQEVMKDFISAGFTNVRTQPLYDLTENSWFYSDGECDDVSIAGKTSFSKGDRHPADVEIVISYHCYEISQAIGNKENTSTGDTSSEIVSEYERAFVRKLSEYNLYYMFDTDTNAVVYFGTNDTYVDKGVFDGQFETGVTINWNHGEWTEIFISKDGSDEATLIDGNGFEWEFEASSVYAAQKILNGIQ